VVQLFDFAEKPLTLAILQKSQSLIVRHLGKAVFEQNRDFSEESNLCNTSVPGAYRSYGRFVIDTFLNRQDEIVALLSDGDMRRIGVEIGVIPRVYYPVPISMHYELSPPADNHA
jgi:hypothetical protein